MTGLRTLVVDDDFMVARVHRGYIERVPGFEVVGVAHSGAEALAAVDRLRPDLVVLDIYLPDMSGLEVLRELRQRQAAVEVIMGTAARDVASVRAAMQAGALHYIVKPFDFAGFREEPEAYRRLAQQGAVIAAARVAAPSQALERMSGGCRRGAPELKRFPGFLGFELWRNEKTLEAVSRWESREAMESYRSSPMFGAHHGPGTGSEVSAEIAQFDAEVVV